METNNMVGNPWKGLKSYREGEVLYGRDEEIRSLSQYIINNVQTVLYGRSGIGKSSILNAGIVPIARKRGLYPVVVRLDHQTDVSYTRQIAAAIEAAGLDAHEVVPVIDAKMESLWEFFHRQTFTVRGQDTPAVPLLILDQFEEIFTLQKNERSKLLFFSELADLINDVRPQYISDRKTGAALSVPVAGAVLASALSFSMSLGKAAGRSADYRESPGLHLVISLREDFLSYLERYTSFIPAMKNNRFALLPINEEQAAEIILKPRPGLVGKDVAKRIIEKVTGRTDFELDGIPELDVDSAVLSLYLSRLYEHKKEDESQITRELVDTIGDDIIHDFFLDCIKGLPEKTVLLLEEELLTRDGRRNNVSRTDLLGMGLEPSVLDDLVNEKKLLRQFTYGEDIRVEFIHDILCPVINRHIEERELEELKRRQKDQETSRHLENRRRAQQRVQNELNVLTVWGRRPIINVRDFGDYLNIPLDESPYWGDIITKGLIVELIDNEFKYHFRVHSDLDASFVGRVIDAGDGSSYTTSLEFLDDAGETIRTMDGIGIIRVRYEGNRIHDILFFEEGDLEKGEVERPLYLRGFCGISLQYDEKGREILRTYIDEDGLPARTVYGFAKEARLYDSEGNLERVLYQDERGDSRRHCNGNYGFRSVFDMDGEEVKRVFIDANGNPTAITSGIFGQEYYYDEHGRLSGIRNLGEDMLPVADNHGYTAVRFDYDDLSRLKTETWLNAAGEPVNGMKSAFCRTEFQYTYEDNGCLLLTESTFDVSGKATEDEDGCAQTTLVYDKQYRLIGLYTRNLASEIISNFSYDYSPSGLMTGGYLKSNKLGEDKVRFWLRFDARNRFVSQYGFMKPMIDNVSGRMVERDPDSDFPIGEINVNEYLQPAPDDNGIFKKIWAESKDGNVLKEFYLDQQGQPVLDQDGAFGRLNDYDDKENLIRVTFLDAEGQPTPRAGSQIVYERTDYDDAEREILKQYYNVNHKPCADENGYFGERYEYSFSPDIKKTVSIDKDGNPTDGMRGYATEVEYLDKKGRTVKEYYLKANEDIFVFSDNHVMEEYIYEDSDDGESVVYRTLDKDGCLVNGPDGVAAKKYIWDVQGRLIFKMDYDNKGCGVPDDDGICGTRIAYSEDGHSSVTTCLGEKEEPCPNKDGYTHKKRVFDLIGREVECYYYDENEIPIMDHEGKFGRRILYTEGENKETYIALDRSGDPMPILSETFSAKESTFDSQNRVILERYLDGQLQPIASSTGEYGCRFSYDDQNGKEWCYLDINGAPMVNSYGYAFSYEQRDEEGRLILDLIFDEQHQLIQNRYGVFALSYEYEGDTSRMLFWDADGKPMCDDRGVAIVYKSRKDDLFTERWLDAEGSLVADSDGFCGQDKFSLEGHRVLTNRVDESEDPVIDEEGFVFHLLEFAEDDETLLMETCLNGEGDPFPCYDGWICRELQYDESGDKNGERYFDAEGNPMPDANGDYGWKNEPTGDPLLTIQAMLGPDGKAHADEDGHYYISERYDEQNRLIEKCFLNKYRHPDRDSKGVYVTKFEYCDDGSRWERYFSIDGSPMCCKRGYASRICNLDEEDRIIKERWFDLDDSPFEDEDGNFGYIREFGDSHIIIALDELGNPHQDKEGCFAIETENIEGDSHYRRIFYNENREKMVLKPGFSSKEVWEDDLGRVIKEVFYDSCDRLFEIKPGIWGRVYKYVEENDKTIKRYANIDQEGSLIHDTEGRVFFEGWTDKYDRLTEQFWFDEHQKPVKDSLGNYGMSYSYLGDNPDEEPVEIISLDKKREPHNNKRGYCKEIRITDKNGEQRSLYLDKDGKFVNPRP